MKNKITEIFIANKVAGVECNSSKVLANYAFFAIRGEKSDGNNYISEAFAKGAVVVFSEDKSQISKYSSKNIVIVEDVRLALAIGTGIIYPKLPEKLIAVTGTNGKSSVVSYCFQILNCLGISAASMGTIGIETTDKIRSQISLEVAQGLTMADPISFRRNLHQLSEAGVKIVAFEASSHGIVQKRMGEVQVDAAGFTSFSQDHLDYHKTMQEYLAAKLQLFERNVKEKGVAVIPNSIEEKDKILEHLKNCKLDVRIINSNDIDVSLVSLGIMGQKFNIVRYNKQYQFQTDIIGSFQSDNLLIAAELVFAVCDADYGKIIEALGRVKAVKGRLERVTDPKNKYQVFVDYAHTPDSLEKSLEELNKLVKDDGKLYVVFGCGGDRDSGKRPVMAKVAVNYADYIIITDDNPRTEDAASIRAQIMAGAKTAIESTVGKKEREDLAVKNVMEIGDRKKAIESAVDLLKKNDILLIAGKGHEDYQIIGTTKHPFSDVLIAHGCINKNPI